MGFLLFTALLIRHQGACAGGADSAGYLTNARLLSQGRLQIPMRVLPGLPPDRLSPFAYVPLDFNPVHGQPLLVPTYSMGLPLLLAGAGLVSGSHAGAWVLVLHALAALWLVYRLARAAGLNANWSWTGALILAVSPVFFFASLTVMSDMPAMVWVTAAVLAAWEARERPWLALAAGMAVAIAVLVRPTDLLVILPVAVALGWSVRRWLLLGLGGLPGAVFLVAVNRHLYGHIAATGYGDMSSLFSLASLPVTLVYCLKWLPVLLTPLVLLAAGVGLRWRRQPRMTAVLVAWAGTFLIFYGTYRPTSEFWWSSRFILPAFPPLIVAALLVGRDLLARWPIRLRGVQYAAAMAAITVYGVFWSHHLHAYAAGRGEEAYPKVMTWLHAHLPPDAVVVAMQNTPALLYYTSFAFVRWDMIDRTDFDQIAAVCHTTGRPLYAALYPFEFNGPNKLRIERNIGPHWTQVAKVETAVIWRYDGRQTP